MNSQEMSFALQALISAVRQELARDQGKGPAWLAEEGERVLAAAQALREAELSAYAAPSQLLDYLGRSWLETHSLAYQHYEQVAQLLAQNRHS